MKNIYETPKSDLNSSKQRSVGSLQLLIIVLTGIVADILLNNLYWHMVAVFFYDAPDTESVTLAFNLTSGVVDFIAGALVAAIAIRREISAALGVSICALIYSLVNSASDHNLAFALRLVYYFSLPLLAGLMIRRVRGR